MKIWSVLGLASKSDIDNQNDAIHVLTKMLVEIKENQRNISCDIEHLNKTYAKQQNECILQIEKTHRDLCEDINNTKSDIDRQFKELLKRTDLNENKVNNSIQKASEHLADLYKNMNIDFEERIMESIKSAQQELNNDIDRQFKELLKRTDLKENKVNNSIQKASEHLADLYKNMNIDFEERMMKSIKSIHEESNNGIESKLNLLEESSRLLLVNSLIDEANDAIALMKSMK